MKKIFIAISAIVLASTASYAQSGLLGALKSAVSGSNATDVISNVISSVTGTSTSTVDLTGTWTYNGIAAQVKSDNILTNIAGNAAVSTIETKADKALSYVGIKPGSGTFTFNSDGSFTFSPMKLVNLSGTWTQEDGSVTLKFGKAISYYTMTGAVSGSSNSVKVIFDGSKFMEFIQKVANYANKITSSGSIASVSNLLATAKSVDAGFELTK